MTIQRRIAVIVALCLICSGCCDYKILWDSSRRQFWVYHCGVFGRLAGGPFSREEEAQRDIKSQRNNPTHWIDADP